MYGRRLVVIVLFLLASVGAKAQRVAISSNIADWAFLGTVNAEANVAVARHISIDAGGRYNPWRFSEGSLTDQFQFCQRTFYGGVRYWPWHVYSGWFLKTNFQWSEYNYLIKGGNPLPKKPLENLPAWAAGAEKLGPVEGDAFGGTFSFGYSWILGKHLNIEIGAGAFGGYATQKAYLPGDKTPSGGRVYPLPYKGRWFVLPGEMTISIMWIL